MMNKNEELANNLGLRKVKIRGDEIHASCPFSSLHFSGRDRHPSFSINISKGVFNCFSCGSRGTIEELVAHVKEISISAACDLLESWGFSKLERTLNEREEEYERPEILPEGLLLYYDKVEDDFAEIYSGVVDDQECLIYPVRNKDGKLVGALARSTEGRWHKAMWNIQKKLYLYGEDLVQHEKPIVIVEGPGDAVAIRKSGIKNVVALMGANVSNAQVEKLLSLSSSFIVWLDKDRAGAKGMTSLWKKMENRALMRYVDPFKVLPEEEKDPRDVLEKNGPEKVQEIIDNAKTFFEHVLEDKCRV
jgi:DNA primase